MHHVMKRILSFFTLTVLTNAQSTQLPEQIVIASKPATVPTLEESRSELLQTPGGTEVIDSSRYLTGRTSTMVDTFRLSPGIVSLSRFGSDEARLSIRGSGIQRTFHGRGIQLLQDGIPLNLADGGFDMQSVDPAAASHIRVWRGANALAHGSSTLGGAIEYTSPTGREPRNLARLEAGSWEYLRASVAAGFAQENTDAAFSFTNSSQQGFRDHSAQESQRFFANFGWQPAEHIENRTFIAAIHSRSELPGNLTKTEMNADPSQADSSATGAIAYDNRRDYDLLRISNKTSILNGPHRFDLITGFSYKDLDHPITPFVGVIDQLSKDWMIGANYGWENEIFGRDHSFRTGVFYQRGTTDNATFGNGPGGIRGALTADADQTAENLAWFAEDQLALGHGFTGIIGATAAHNTRRNDSNLGGVSYDRSDHNLSPKLGVRYDREAWQAFANVSGSYEPPSFSETNSMAAANDAQRATTFEIGSRGNHRFIGWDLALYHSEVKDEFLALNDAAGAPLGTINADRTIHQGVELGAQVDLLGADLAADAAHRLMFRTAWTYGRFVFDNDPVYGDNDLAGLPPHLIRGELLWENDRGWYFGPTFDWVPEKTWIDHANSLSADAYALLGFKFGQRRDSGLSWFVEIKNLTDETYAATTGVIADAGGADSRNFLPGDGRSVFAGLEWRW